jgi:DNA polymerase-3 subunit delta'
MKANEEENEEVNRSIHGDFHIIKKEKDKKNISIEQVRDFIKTLALSSFLGSYKIGIIKHADTLSLEAANALLKTLEEPNEKVIIVLICQSVELLPATIVSRSQVLNFYPVATDKIYDYLLQEKKATRSQAKNLSHLALGRPALAVRFLEDQDFFKTYSERLDVFLNFFNQNVIERLQAIEGLLGKYSTGQESVRIVARILEVWQSALRDCLLLEFNSPNLIQHEIKAEQLKNLKSKINILQLLKLEESIEGSQKFLAANVSPKLVLENIALTI